ncbi:hypothetical protein ONZ43_g5459 [Nemania bipapillata]|uniref:Uncharacterized protein n=1 Tax=Nemania bipapillata TaxID=110536 RepID=A0ACC2IAN2_9PEZI|nr:hypothetical protein ONZ43_g5459 [Nemania bipapillata]
MLATRRFETEQSHWSSKLKTAFDKPTSSRMSSYDGSISTQPDWQGHYSFLPPRRKRNDNGVASQQRSSSAQNNNLDAHGQTSTSTLSSPTNHHRIPDPLGLRQAKHEPTSQEQASISGISYAIKTESAHEEAPAGNEPSEPTVEPNPTTSVPSTEQNLHAAFGGGGNVVETIVGKEEDEEVLDDDEMIEGDGDVEGEGEDETPSQPQTAAERTAARRKMKRFRLTHQQTRFLMSEFAKQPHPDAAHRERLSREIPGLSPRQVQVWFQNRRAKIKRMTADDRDRMIKMRAVPDDFDNVQALHSPYGAVHALGTPITPPVDFGSSPYSDQMIRPLLVDTMRRDSDDHLSPTGLSPAFGSIGFTPSGTMGSSDILSPLSPSSTDRGYYSSHLSNSIGSSAGGTVGYDTGSYTTSSLQSPTTNINYSSLQQPSQARSRLRAASATLPLGLDLRHQYRSFSSSHSLQPSNHASTPRAASTAPYGTSASYSMSFPSAPLTAPIEYSIPRTPSIRSSVHDFSIPQMSAPIAPPHDFTQALHGSIPGSSSQTPIRNSFSGGALTLDQAQGSNDKGEEHAQDGLGGPGVSLKRKRSSFSLAQVPHTSSPSQGSQSYGHTN